ncbi:MAG: D-alanine--D-alanine ligase (EC [uncultured Sulfurovum sp.]|uniref:D-alanine--D-alanine ligase n=1 Tax=uncultured Sulfurovum sp. TaxID=269237 RepID=A0A6S6U5L8_9BACT|nr:MAG: D-alanine--D-alanine ligase (EC [uncultured Sulfurovum sp.]
MNIAILFGGSSYEHEISIVSAITLKKVLKNTALSFIFVDANREFYLIDSENMKSNYFANASYKKAKKLILKKGAFCTVGMMGLKEQNLGTVLNLIHGRDGEDGKIASLLEFNDIAYISPRVDASVLSYNKLYTKLYAESLGVKVVPYLVLNSADSRDIELEYPVIIKPVRLGSSIGVSIVKSADALDYALDVAFEFDNQVLIEPFIEGVLEYNQAGCKTSDFELSIVEEPNKEEFLDFEKKYLDFSRDGKVGDADISSELKTDIQEAFKKVYASIFEGSIIRCDFFVVDGEVLLNEINPIPGSMGNYLFEDFEGMVGRLVNHLPKEHSIKIDYSYINSIQSAKGGKTQ